MPKSSPSSYAARRFFCDWLSGINALKGISLVNRCAQSKQLDYKIAVRMTPRC
jgi:hypothetical protein